jgi:hypothetical protein
LIQIGIPMSLHRSQHDCRKYRFYQKCVFGGPYIKQSKKSEGIICSDDAASPARCFYSHIVNSDHGASKMLGDRWPEPCGRTFEGEQENEEDSDHRIQYR